MKPVPGKLYWERRIKLYVFKIKVAFFFNICHLIHVADDSDMIEQPAMLLFLSRTIIYFSVEKKVTGMWSMSFFKPVISSWSCDQCQVPKKHSLNKLRVFFI